MSREPKVESREPDATCTARRPTPRASRPHLARYLGIYAALWKNSVTRETMFKGNFLLWIVVEMLWFALQLSFHRRAVICTPTPSARGPNGRW